jgi:hypothetical protein
MTLQFNDSPVGLLRAAFATSPTGELSASLVFRVQMNAAEILDPFERALRQAEDWCTLFVAPTHQARSEAAGTASPAEGL